MEAETHFNRIESLLPENATDSLYMEKARKAAREVIQRIGVDDFNQLIDSAKDAVNEGGKGVLLEDQTGELGGLRVSVTPDQVKINSKLSDFSLPMNEVIKIKDDLLEVNKHSK